MSSAAWGCAAQVGDGVEPTESKVAEDRGELKPEVRAGGGFGSNPFCAPDEIPCCYNGNADCHCQSEELKCAGGSYSPKYAQ
jgi:hypothetical protein